MTVKKTNGLITNSKISKTIETTKLYDKIYHHLSVITVHLPPCKSNGRINYFTTRALSYLFQSLAAVAFILVVNA